MSNANGIELGAAAMRGDLQQVTKLLQRGADVNGADKDGWTALHFAAGGGHVAVTEKLLQLGADANRPKPDSWTALHLAACIGHVAVLEALLKRGAQVNRTTDDGGTALKLAAENGHVAVVESLLARGANVNSTDKYGNNALQDAAFEGHVSVVETLLAHGADVNGRGPGGLTALHCAVLNGHVAVVESLLARAEVNVAAEALGSNALHCAAFNGHVAVVESLLARGAEVNVADDEMGSTALQISAEEGHVAVVEALLAQGAELNSTNKNGSTALHYAAENGHVAIVEALLAQGADVDRANNFGNTSLHRAVSSNNESIALALWSAGADALKKNNREETPLSLLPEQSSLKRILRTAPPPPLTEVQKLWLRAKETAITQPHLLAALKAEHITSFSDFVLAHHLLLLAVRQRVITRSQLLAFGGRRDYILENVYLPVTKFALSDEQKFWLSGLLSYAEKKLFIRDGNAVLVKVVADLRSEIRHTRLEMQTALVSVAREIISLNHRVDALERWTSDAAKSFQRLCQNQEQILSDMQNMAASLQQLHGLLRKQQRHRTIAGVLGFCLSMIPVVGGALAGATFAAQEIAFGINAEHLGQFGSAAVHEILAVDISNFQTVTVLTSNEYMSKLDPVARQRVEAVVEHTDFKTLPNLQQSLAVVVEELKDSEDIDESDEEQEEAELRQRFAVLASRSASGEHTVTAQDAIPELKHMLQVHLTHHGINITVNGDDVEDAVMEQMDHGTGLLDMDAFIKSFHELCRKYPTVARRREPPELRQRFQNAARAKKLLKCKIAKLMLLALFRSSGGESGSSSSEQLSFKRTRQQWNDAEVDQMLRNYSAAENFIDEDGFVEVGMKVLFG